jgi:hypothetical protein
MSHAGLPLASPEFPLERRARRIREEAHKEELSTALQALPILRPIYVTGIQLIEAKLLAVKRLVVTSAAARIIDHAAAVVDGKVLSSSGAKSRARQ